MHIIKKNIESALTDAPKNKTLKFHILKESSYF